MASGSRGGQRPSLGDYERALTYVFISHDLNVIEYVHDRVLVMYLGQIVESGTADALAEAPKHTYMQALFASAPSMDPDRRLERPPIAGDLPNPINPPSGCRFRTRCAFVMPRCAEAAPPAVAIAPGHDVACCLYDPGARSRPETVVHIARSRAIGRFSSDRPESE